MRYFNPPAPCGAGLLIPNRWRADEDFNPPAPCGAGLPRMPLQISGRKFQSTRPLWGGTVLDSIEDKIGSISIHPPLVGRDRVPQNAVTNLIISIHPPLAGRDAASDIFFLVSDISIHPPLVGRDLDRLVNCCHNLHFNPPAPCGAGRRFSAGKGGKTYFNPPAPCGAGQRSCTKKLCKTSHIAQKVHLPWPY